MRATFVALVLSVAACGGASQTPTEASSTDAPPAAAEVRAVERVELLAEAVEDADCDGYATRVDAWLAADAAEVATLARQSREHPELEADQLAPLEGRLAAAFEIIIRAADQCADHPGATAAYEGFERFIAES